MKEIAVVYKSNYGYTEKYAKWISEDLNADLFEVSKTNPQNLLNYKTIIYGGGLYASGINGVSIITKNIEKLSDKNIIVYTVGLESTENPEKFAPLVDKNFTKEQQMKIKIFHLRGGVDYKKLGIIHKAMMAMLKKMIEKKNDGEYVGDSKLFLETYGSEVDFTDKATITPLVDYVKAL